MEPKQYDMTDAGQALNAHLDLSDNDTIFMVGLTTDAEILIDLGGGRRLVMDRETAVAMADSIRRCAAQADGYIASGKPGRVGPVI